VAAADATVTVHVVQRHLDRLEEIVARIDAWRAELDAERQIEEAEQAADDLCQDILANAPDGDYQCEGGDHAGAVAYVRALETRLEALAAQITKLAGVSP
jgi:hypothetical protein